jgi:hypothetical protein
MTTEQQIRQDNPTTTTDSGERVGAGDPFYEAKIAEWVAAHAAQSTPSVPQTLANWRVKAVLDMQGLTPTIDAAIDSMPDSPEKIVISRAWYGNGDVQRDSPTVSSFMAILNLTGAQVDDMFRIAATFNP